MSKNLPNTLEFSEGSTDPNKKANELYVKALEYYLEMKKSESYSSAFEYYKKVKAYIDRITSKYPDSNIAVGLVSDEIRIGGFTLSEFRSLESSLRLMAEAEHDPISCALLVAKAIESEYSKTIALVKIAGKYAEIGQRKKAAQILSQALKMVKSIEDKDVFKNKALFEIAVKCAEAGLFDMAFEAAEAIEAIERSRFIITYNPYGKAEVLSEIAIKYAEAGLFDQSIETAKEIESVESLIKIADKYIEIEQKEKAAQVLSKALKIAMTILIDMEKQESQRVEYYDPEIVVMCMNLDMDVDMYMEETDDLGWNSHEWPKKLLAEIAVKCAEAGLFDMAFGTAEAIGESMFSCIYEKAEVLSKIAIKCAEVGLFDQALKAAEEIEHEFLKAESLVEIAGKYAEIGQRKKAVQILSQALKTFETIEENMLFSYKKAEVLSKIAGKYAEIGQRKKAVQILSQALKTFEAIFIDMDKRKFEHDRYSDLTFITNFIAMRENLEMELEMYRENLGWDKDEEYECFKYLLRKLFAEIAVKCAEAGLFDMAFGTAEAIGESMFSCIYEKAEVLSKIAIKCAEVGLFDQALKIAKAIEYDTSKKAEALSKIAVKYAEAGLFDQALKIAKAIEYDTSKKAEALSEIAVKLTEAGQKPSQKEIALLSEIILEKYPIESFWK